MISNIRSRVSAKTAALVITFALLITGSGLASLASLSDTLTDTVTFNTLSVDLRDGVAESAAVTFSNIDPSVGGTFTQTINLTNSGSASATVSVAGLVTTGAGSDLDSAITVAAYDGVTRIVAGTPGVWPRISGIGTDVGTFTLNAGASRSITLTFFVAANPNLTTTSLVAEIRFTATHP